MRRILFVTVLAAACIVIPQAAAGTNAHATATGTCPAGNAAIVNPTLTVNQGTGATATFKIAPFCSNIEVNLASYDAPSAEFALPQTLIDYAPKPLNGSTRFSYNGGATYTLTTNVSPCFFQVDLVRGPVIVDLTSTNQYLDRKLQWLNGGTACATDHSPPQCQLTSTINGPPKRIQVTVQDPQSGLQSVNYTIKNGTVTPDAGPFTTNPDGSVSGSVDFSFGLLTPLVVTATKTNQTLGSRVSLTVTNRAGLTTACDPVWPGTVHHLSPFAALAKLFTALTKLVTI
jgi:hypothetical protein